MTDIESKLSDWTSEQISLTLGDTPRGKTTGNEYMVWAFDLPKKYLKDFTLRAKIEKIQKSTLRLERSRKKEPKRR